MACCLQQEVFLASCYRAKNFVNACFNGKLYKKNYGTTTEKLAFQ